MNIICKDSSMHRKPNMQQHLAKYAAEASVATGYVHISAAERSWTQLQL